MFCLLWRDIKKNCVSAVSLNKNEVHSYVINYDNDKSCIHVAIAYGIEITLRFVITGGKLKEFRRVLEFKFDCFRLN